MGTDKQIRHKLQSRNRGKESDDDSESNWRVL
jgi:hypothetical protein